MVRLSAIYLVTVLWTVEILATQCQHFLNIDNHDPATRLLNRETYIQWLQDDVRYRDCYKFFSCSNHMQESHAVYEDTVHFTIPDCRITVARRMFIYDWILNNHPEVDSVTTTEGDAFICAHNWWHFVEQSRNLPTPWIVGWTHAWNYTMASTCNFDQHFLLLSIDTIRALHAYYEENPYRTVEEYLEWDKPYSAPWHVDFNHILNISGVHRYPFPVSKVMNNYFFGEAEFARVAELSLRKDTVQEEDPFSACHHYLYVHGLTTEKIQQSLRSDMYDDYAVQMALWKTNQRVINPDKNPAMSKIVLKECEPDPETWKWFRQTVRQKKRNRRFIQDHKPAMSDPSDWERCFFVILVALCLACYFWYKYGRNAALKRVFSRKV